MKILGVLLFPLLGSCVQAWDATRVLSPAVTTTSRIKHLAFRTVPLLVRGGACADTDVSLFVKIGTSAAVEAGAMLATLKVGKMLSDKTEDSLPKIGGVSLAQWASILLIVFGSAFFGSIVDGGLSAATRQVLDPNVIPGDPNWYSNLKKPFWNPPGWLFPIMWLLIVKPTQAIALSKLFQQDKVPWKALALFCAHLGMGDAWNKVFFGLQCVGRGAAVISVFYGLLLASVYAFYRVAPTAAAFLIPSVGWITTATLLNWSIYLLNK